MDKILIFQIFNFLFFLLNIYNLIFFVWIISSWFPIDRSNIVMEFIDSLINPVYGALLRTFPPLQIGMMNFSPFYMFIFLSVLEIALNFLRQLVFSMML